MDEVTSAWQQLRNGTITLDQALQQLVTPTRDISLHLVDPQIVKRFSDSVRNFLRNNAYLPPVVPLLLWQNRYYLGSPLGLSSAEVSELKGILKTDITIMPIAEKSYRNWFRCFQVKEILQNLDPVYVSLLNEVESEQDMTEAAEASLTFAKNQTDRIFNLITQAISLRASDIHLEPTFSGLVVRFRIDGILRDITQLPIEIGRKVVVAIKVMSDMNIAETRRPQDGRIREDFSIGLQEMAVSIRVSTLPCVVPRSNTPAEKVVMRLLRQKNSFEAIEDLGFTTLSCETYKRWIRQPQGIIIFTGPTGSGKTSTLYTTLQTVATREKNISTIEDPVEYSVEGVTQTQVLEVAGMTFAAGLRSILRQDPDVVMVGEIRDADTAITAIRAALTGHLVLTTLHSNDALGAIPRLKNLGVDPGLVSDALLGIVSQRLVRRVCPYCAESYTPGTQEKELFQLTDAQLISWQWIRGQGCVKCFNSGYLGREGIFELLDINDFVRSAIHQDSMEALRDFVTEFNELSFRAAAMDKIRQGKTNIDEILRVLPESNVSIRRKPAEKPQTASVQINADFIGLNAREHNLNADFVSFAAAESHSNASPAPGEEETQIQTENEDWDEAFALEPLISLESSESEDSKLPTELLEPLTFSDVSAFVDRYITNPGGSTTQSFEPAEIGFAQETPDTLEQAFVAEFTDLPLENATLPVPLPPIEVLDWAVPPTLEAPICQDEVLPFFADFCHAPVQELFATLTTDTVLPTLEEIPIDFNVLLEEVVYLLQTRFDKATRDRMKKLLFAACTGNWPDPQQDLGVVHFGFLIINVLQLYPRLGGLESCLKIIVRNLNKAELYEEISDILVTALGSVYRLQECGASQNS